MINQHWRMDRVIYWLSLVRDGTEALGSDLSGKSDGTADPFSVQCLDVECGVDIPGRVEETGNMGFQAESL